ncbi:Hypothetical predicted protein [Mytilus galloprovincialis]|uniref:Uncharacterized protein n=1 Tax=Mytilus galloprovincialis TaxID=29158 RepID=A0A8B6BNY6_MYTGA|nr:Hypothetical predicted protein [Mytilus galloprovincialis]
MPDRLWTSNEALEFYTDSAGGSTLGFGIYFKGRWAHGLWPRTWHKRGLLSNITFLELFPVMVAIILWGSELRNKKVLFHIDNEGAVHIINKNNVISRSGQQCFMPTEGSPSQYVVNHLLQGTPNTRTFSNELGGLGLSHPLALGVNPKLKADIWSNKYTNLEDLLKSKSRVVKYVPVEKDDCLTFVKNSSSDKN